MACARRSEIAVAQFAPAGKGIYQIRDRLACPGEVAPCHLICACAWNRGIMCGSHLRQVYPEIGGNYVAHQSRFCRARRRLFSVRCHFHKSEPTFFNPWRHPQGMDLLCPLKPVVGCWDLAEGAKMEDEHIHGSVALLSMYFTRSVMYMQYTQIGPNCGPEPSARAFILSCAPLISLIRDASCHLSQLAVYHGYLTTYAYS
jgi:hypothetical protein